MMMKYHRWNEGEDSWWIYDIVFKSSSSRKQVEEMILHYSLRILREKLQSSWVEGVLGKVNVLINIENFHLTYSDQIHLAHLAQINECSASELKGYILKILKMYHIHGITSEFLEMLHDLLRPTPWQNNDFCPDGNFLLFCGNDSYGNDSPMVRYEEFYGEGYNAL